MLFDVILLSIVEGITEFLPISSTGHLILLSEWLKMDKSFYEVFDISIQLGAILAVLLLYPTYFKERIIKIRSKETMVILVAIAPILLIGYLLKDVIKGALFLPNVIFMGLIIGGIGLIIAEKKIRHQHSDDNKSKVTIRQAWIVGVWQCLALWPGMSRSAMTIIGAMFAGLNRVTAASFSFVIAVPVMAVVVGYDLLSASSVLSRSAYGWIAIGMGLSFIVAWATMRWFLGFIQRQGLLVFGVYRIVLGMAGLLFYG